MDTTIIARVTTALNAHANAWQRYNAAIAALEQAKAAWSKADFVMEPGSPEMLAAENAVITAKADARLVRDLFFKAADALLIAARPLATESNTLWETGLAEARAKWEKVSVGARLYNHNDRERDFRASPWRVALPHEHAFEEYPDKLGDLPDVGPEFAYRVRGTMARYATLTAALKSLRAL